MECLAEIDDYLLASSDDYIFEFNINKAKIYNKIKLLYGAYYFHFFS